MHDIAGEKKILEGLSGEFPLLRNLWAGCAYRGLEKWVIISLD